MDPAEKLREMGFAVERKNQYWVVVDGQIDFFYPRGKWYDRITKDYGRKPLDQIASFIARRLIERQQCEELCNELKSNHGS